MQAAGQAIHYFAGNLRKIKTSFIGNQRTRLGFIVAAAGLSLVDELMRPYNNGPTVARLHVRSKLEQCILCEESTFTAYDTKHPLVCVLEISSSKMTRCE